MDDNRRLEYRIMADLTVGNLETDSSNSRTIQGTIRELSASRCRLESSIDLQIGQIIKLSFQLEGNETIKNVRARIVRKLSQQKNKAAAVEFIDMSETEQYKIREFVVWKEAQEEAR